MPRHRHVSGVDVVAVVCMVGPGGLGGAGGVTDGPGGDVTADVTHMYLAAMPQSQVGQMRHFSGDESDRKNVQFGQVVGLRLITFWPIVR